MIRILHVLGGLDRGGAETMVMNLYRAIDRTKVQFDFIVHNEKKQAYTDEILDLGGKIFHFPAFNGMNYFKMKKLWNQFFRDHPEYKILHSHVRSYASLYIPIAKKVGLKTIIHSHSTSNGRGIGSFVKWIMQFPLRFQADFFLGCSVDAGRWLFGNKIVESTSFHVLKNAIDIEKYSFSENFRKKIREDLQIEKKFVLGNVGRLTYPKNHLFLIDIFNFVHKKNQNSVLIIVGNGELELRLKKKVRSYGLDDSVLFLGSRSDIPAVLSAMDVFVFPSIYEGLGIAAVESQSSGLRTICSDSIPKDVALTDLVKFIPLKESPQKWADQILKLCENVDRRTYQKKIATAGYDIKDSITYIQNLYDTLLNR